ncbi:hypothetical protein Pcinc_026905 [Petrolisthes cinctipes]|uniref:C-type lectin domain-containing protein n=1 Tax=Petrolisthes cinctipes TaxID=88211 RepID=A0AAE1F762_PETCI|nr:hypothetical protein Pcinc_026905 [Petrolisthes cinctipes]
MEEVKVMVVVVMIILVVLFLVLLVLVVVVAQEGQLWQPEDTHSVNTRYMDRMTAHVDLRHHNSDYHYSWLHDGGTKYDWVGARHYCKGLGQGWYPVGISTYQENQAIKQIIQYTKLKNIWTGGYKKSYNGWMWSNREPFHITDWSRTGHSGRPQPDNDEDDENCLAILNNYYQDGVSWHDVGCGHRKPVICERSGHHSTSRYG